MSSPVLDRRSVAGSRFELARNESRNAARRPFRSTEPDEERSVFE